MGCTVIIMKKRRNYTRREAVQTLKDWLWKNHLRQTDFLEWLSKRGILITPAYLSLMLSGKIAPGKRFKEIFKEITGVTLVDGLIEDQQREGG